MGLYSSQKTKISATFTLASPQVAFKTFTDEQRFSKIQESEVKIGDAVLIWHQNQGDVEYLDHIAIYISDDLWFERAGTGEDVPFRITTIEMLSNV